MHKSLFLLGALAAAMSLCACSADDDPAMPDDQHVGPNSQYLAINIMSADNGSRAVGDNEFEEGELSENKIKNAIFFFYNDNGDAVNVTYEDDAVNNDPSTSTKPGDMKSNYVYVYEENGLGAANPSSEMPNVESIKQAVLVLHCKPGKLPTRLVCFANMAPYKLKDYANKNMQEMRGLVDNLDVKDLTYLRLGGGGSTIPTSYPYADFFMSSSVYNPEQSQTPSQAPSRGGSATSNQSTSVCYSTISTANYGKNADDAKGRPVKVYVERALAKVKFATTNTETLVTQSGAPLENCINIGSQGGQSVYFHIEGWGIGDRAPQSYCLKNIDGIKNPFTDWNDPDRYRSYWAVNPSLPGDDRIWGNSLYNKFASHSLTEALYTQENACGVENPTAPARATKVMIVGKMVNSRGVQMGMYEIAGFKSIYSNENEIKTAFLQQLKYAGITIWKRNHGNAEEIGTGDLILEATPATDVKTYETVVRLKSEEYGSHSSIIYFDSYENASNPYRPGHNAEEIYNMYFKKMPIKVWKEGMGYYYAELKHIAPGANNPDNYAGYGVVRNHIYDFTLTGLSGFPTPVYDPEVVIIPEKPVDENVYVAAQINVLSWRIVNQEANIEWN